VARDQTAWRVIGRSVEDYTAALGLEPGNANAYHNRGSALEKLNRNEEALTDFTKVTE
jgi:tetratricopeptide (TPR) repeat protein